MKNLIRTSSGKTYTRKQITEAIAYQEKQLSNLSLNVISDNDRAVLSFNSLKKLVRESILNETAGKNEHDVALSLYNAFNRNPRLKNCPGMLIDGDGNVTYNGHFYEDAKKEEKIDKKRYFVPDKESSKNRMYNNLIPGEQPDTSKDLKRNASMYHDYGPMQTEAGRCLVELKSDLLGSTLDMSDISWAVVEIGSLDYPGDVVVIVSSSYVLMSSIGNVSVIEVKSDSLGKAIFQPTFTLKEKNGTQILIPSAGTRYESIWGDLIDDINDEISKEQYQEIIKKHQMLSDNTPNKTIISKFPLNVDFEDFIGRYSSKNPFGPIEYIAMGYNDDITYYKLVSEPVMDLYGTGQANRLRKRKAESIGGIFNAAYLTVKFRGERIVGVVDFGHNGALMASDADLAVSFKYKIYK